MEPSKPTDTELALRQWERLYHLFLGLGHEVELVEPLPALPDMVFAANGATVLDGRALAAKFRHRQRQAEAPAFISWLDRHGFDVHAAKYVNEGEGDFIVAGERILAGSGFRTAPQAHAEAQVIFGLPVVALTLIDPRFYHLDTALAVLDYDEIMYYPAAFDQDSQATLRALYPDAILASAADAEVLGLNAVSDGRHVVLAAGATGLRARLWQAGYLPISVVVSELLKAGGGIKCCTLELRD
jgi:N-dimethylarginine dimethylaminohydrolase